MDPVISLLTLHFHRCLKMSESPRHSATNTSSFCVEHPIDAVSSTPPPQYSPPSDDTTIANLIDNESNHLPHPDYLLRFRSHLMDTSVRQSSIDWILKVHRFFHFRPVTAFLSINYFDRLLSTHSLPKPNGWPFQLLSVACLSLAAKMEEPQVPLLLDLQIFEPKFIFEPKTIQRTELWVMTHLNWRLRSITPFDYLEYFIAKLPSSSNPQPEFQTRILSTASDLIISTTRVIDFLGFTPSSIAAAAVLCSAGESWTSVTDNNQWPAIFHDRVNKEKVRSCHQLMEECVVDTCPTSGNRVLGAEPAPPSSPVGVLDAVGSISYDTLSDVPGSSGQDGSAKRPRSSAADVHY